MACRWSSKLSPVFHLSVDLHKILVFIIFTEPIKAKVVQMHRAAEKSNSMCIYTCMIYY